MIRSFRVTYSIKLKELLASAQASEVIKAENLTLALALAEKEAQDKGWIPTKIEELRE